MPLDWDANTYDRVGTGVMALGHEVLERVQLRGDETVLDAGCGTGEVTAALAALVPRGRVYAVDASPRMVELARERLSPEGASPLSRGLLKRGQTPVRVLSPEGASPLSRGLLKRGQTPVRVWCQDLLELEVPEPVDLVFSTATFHWIADHERLFARLRAALKPGGRLVAQCGGAGNIAAIRAAIEQVSGDSWMPWNFATPQETEARLRAAGFSEARAWLYDRPVQPDEPLEFLKTLILGEHLPRLPEAERDGFARSVLERLDQPFVAHYVRLNIEARVSP